MRDELAIGIRLIPTEIELHCKYIQHILGHRESLTLWAVNIHRKCLEGKGQLISKCTFGANEKI